MYSLTNRGIAESFGKVDYIIIDSHNQSFLQDILIHFERIYCVYIENEYII